jgi:hypothetical protein
MSKAINRTAKQLVQNWNNEIYKTKRKANLVIKQEATSKPNISSSLNVNLSIVTTTH